MTDDPRIEAGAQRLMMSHPSWFKRLTTVGNRNPEHPGHADALYAARTIAEAAVKGTDAEDPLRALLADDERLLEFATKARYDATRQRSDLPSWEVAPKWYREAWATETAEDFGAVLAALREVAGL